MHKFKGANGTPVYVDPQAIAMVRLGERGDVTWLTLRGTNDEWGVRESPEEVVALIESAARPAADADYAPLVDAARAAERADVVAYLRGWAAYCTEQHDLSGRGVVLAIRRDVEIGAHVGAAAKKGE